MKKIFISLFCSLILFSGVSFANAQAVPSSNMGNTDSAFIQMLLNQIAELQKQVQALLTKQTVPADAPEQPTFPETPSTPKTDGSPSDAGKALIKVLSPSGGENYKAGSKVKVTWKTENLPSSVQSVLLSFVRYENGSPVGVFGVKSVANSGSYEKDIEENIRPGLYKLKVESQCVSESITEQAECSMYGENDGLFEILPKVTASSGVKVTYPNGEDKLKIGQPYTLKWEAKSFNTTKPNKVADAEISLLNTRTSKEVVIANIKNTGSHKWKVPETLDGMNLFETQDSIYRVKIKVWNDTQSDFDLSDKTFSFVDVRASNVRVTRATNTPKSRDVRTGETDVEFLGFTIQNNGSEKISINKIRFYISPLYGETCGLSGGEIYESGIFYNNWRDQDGMSRDSTGCHLTAERDISLDIPSKTKKDIVIKSDIEDNTELVGKKILIGVEKISFSIGNRSFEANVTGVKGNAMKVVSISPTTNKPIIKISAPNGGETFKTSPESDMGTSIRWTSTNMGSMKVRIDLIGEDGLVRNIASGASNTGYRFWHVSMDIPTGKYKIKIASEDQGASAVDMSDGYFNVVNTNIIAEVPSLPAPTGVSATASRENTSVSWNSVSGATAYWIYRASGSTITERSKEKAVLIGSAGGVGATEKVSYIDEKPKCGVTHAYYVKTHNATTGKTSDMSASAETLIPCPIVPGNTSPKITLTNPNGGSFRMKDILKIRWDAENLGAVSNQKIELMVGEALVCTLATPAITNGENVYEWEISSSQCSYVGPGPGYKIRISLASGSTVVSDTSDSAFTILSSVDAPTLTITSPNGGEMFEREKTMEIKWSSTNYTGNVVLTLVDRNRYPVMQIKSGIPASTSSFVWTIPKANIYEANYKILIQGDLVAGYQAPLDYSDNTFYISVPTTTSGALGKPTNFAFLGYEMSGNTAISKFEYMDNAVGESGYYIYWDDGMKGYVSTTTLTSDTGKRTSYIGRIFDCTKIPKTVYIRAFKDLDLSEPSNVVSIPTPPVCEAPVTKVLSPNGGESYKQGDSVSIKWTATNLGSSNSVAISVYKARSDNNYYGIAPDFGLTFYNNVSGGVVQDEGSYTWTIPQNFTTGQYVVFVAGAKGTYDTSDAPFTITTASGGVSANILDSVKIQLEGLKELLMKLR